MKKKPAPGTVWVLRNVDKERKAFGGFLWPETGPVEAPDWSPTPECGRGLHGWARGEGDGMVGTFGADRLWQIVEVEEKDLVPLDGKVKFPRGVVLFTGSQRRATFRMRRAYPGAAVIGATVTAGAYGTATAGAYGAATAGYRGTATAGAYGAATAGYGGTATAGADGTATAGYRGTATAGYRGTATAGYRGTATAGDYGTATAGDYGTATAGDYGTIVLAYFDGVRKRLVVGYVGEGIEANRAYRLNDRYELVLA